MSALGVHHHRSGQRHDAVAFELTLAQVAVARTGPGRPRTRPDAVLADKAYSSRAIRAHLSGRGIKAVIAIKDDQRAARRRKGSRGGRPPAFDRSTTATATPSNEQSTSSARTAPSPPATTNATTSTAAPSPSPPS